MGIAVGTAVAGGPYRDPRFQSQVFFCMDHALIASFGTEHAIGRGGVESEACRVRELAPTREQ